MLVEKGLSRFSTSPQTEQIKRKQKKLGFLLSDTF